MRLFLFFALSALMLTACVGPPRDRRPSGGGQAVKPTDPQTRQCLSDLNHLKARYSLLPEQDFGGGCSIKGSVQLFTADVPITAVRAIRCPMARAVALWVRNDVQRAARDVLGSRIIRIDSMGAYSCRNIVGNGSGKLSQHATGNAIDIGAFILADGRRISVKEGWNSTDADQRQFLRAVRAGACSRFVTVLSPDYNAAHHDHLHFDLGGKAFCR